MEPDHHQENQSPPPTSHHLSIQTQQVAQYPTHSHDASSSFPSRYGGEDHYPGRQVPVPQAMPSSPTLYYHGYGEEYRSSNMSSSMPKHFEYSPHAHFPPQQQPPQLPPQPAQGHDYSHHHPSDYPRLTFSAVPGLRHRYFKQRFWTVSAPPISPLLATPPTTTSPSLTSAAPPLSTLCLAIVLQSSSPPRSSQGRYRSTRDDRSIGGPFFDTSATTTTTNTTAAVVVVAFLTILFIVPMLEDCRGRGHRRAVEVIRIGGATSGIDDRGDHDHILVHDRRDSHNDIDDESGYAMSVVPRHPNENQPRRRRRPNESYSNIIIKAILHSEHKRLKLSEIYEYVKKEIPQFGDDRGWQNTVRHNLSLNPCFRRETAEEAAMRSPTSPTEDFDEGQGPGQGSSNSKGKQIVKPVKRGKGSYWVLDMNELDEHFKPKKYMADQQSQNQSQQKQQQQQSQQPPQHQQQLQQQQQQGQEQSQTPVPHGTEGTVERRPSDNGRRNAPQEAVSANVSMKLMVSSPSSTAPSSFMAQASYSTMTTGEAPHNDWQVDRSVLSPALMMEIDDEVASMAIAERWSSRMGPQHHARAVASTSPTATAAMTNDAWSRADPAGLGNNEHESPLLNSDHRVYSGDDYDDDEDDDYDELDEDEGEDNDHDEAGVGDDVLGEEMEVEPWVTTLTTTTTTAPVGRVGTGGNSGDSLSHPQPCPPLQYRRRHHGRGAMSLASLLNPVGDPRNEFSADD
ncbi:Forkhead box protein I2 [Actinomortierella ambigua]|nr:Forkhead box protein I2 [Actinomortierella ambigua]